MRGTRGLPGDLSLARLLDRERGVRNRLDLPRLNCKEILAWAVAHQQRTGQWPTTESGAILEAPEETWAAVDACLRAGGRGLRAGSSLARLLDQHGLKRNVQDLPPLTKRQILAWADAHYTRTGDWPNVNSGPVAESPDDNWAAIDNVLRVGLRGQPGGNSLSRLLMRHRGLRHPYRLSPLSEQQILRWAELHFQRTGAWPKYNSGPVFDARGETWAGIDSALRYGKRGLPAGLSVAKLIAPLKDRCQRPRPEEATADAEEPCLLDDGELVSTNP